MVSPVINQCYIQHSDLRNCQKEILITYQTLNGGRFAKQVLCNYRPVSYTHLSAHSQTVKKWLAECESSLVDGATERNSVGCIFALKANYGYTETPQRVEIVNGQQPEQIAADIAARHKIGQVEKPELPEDL